MKVIVLTINPYKEKDAIISGISENEYITFLARGIRDPKSKNAAINNALCIADIELMDGNFKYPILKSSKPLFSSLKMEMNEKYLGSLLLMDEMILNLFPSEEQYIMFPYLEKAVETLKDKSDWLMTLLLLMSHIIRLGGFQLEVNKCVICGKRNGIVAFSFTDGGFICQDCYDTEVDRDLNKTQMLLLREIVNCPDFSLIEKDYNQDDAKVLFTKFYQYMEEAFGYRFKNIRLLIE